MCRWLAYYGSPLRLDEVLLKPERSLVDQSLHSKLGATTTNGDGFGVGWYDGAPCWLQQNVVESKAFGNVLRVHEGCLHDNKGCGRGRFPRVAGRRVPGMASRVSAFGRAGAEVTFTRPRWAGNAYAGSVPAARYAFSAKAIMNRL